MTASSSTVLDPETAEALLLRLGPLCDRPDRGGDLSADPVAFVRRYSDPKDQEIAAFYAGFLAFGRVDLFRPILHEWFQWFDDGGGPYQRTLGFEVEDARPLFTLNYRWVRGPHFVLFTLAMQQVLRDHGSLESFFEGPAPLRRKIQRACDALRSAMIQRSGDVGVNLVKGSLPRGLMHLVASPAGGSACKRWHMVLRWLVRQDDGVDLGLWTEISPSDLLIPVDTHVHRIARMIGLTGRSDASWRTAEEITNNLKKLDPIDPVRFDFALAHLGISHGCKGRWHEEICPSCPLVEVCSQGQLGSGP